MSIVVDDARPDGRVASVGCSITDLESRGFVSCVGLMEARHVSSLELDLRVLLRTFAGPLAFETLSFGLGELVVETNLALSFDRVVFFFGLPGLRFITMGGAVSVTEFPVSSPFLLGRPRLCLRALSDFSSTV